jgi:hypothetical protein
MDKHVVIAHTHTHVCMHVQTHSERMMVDGAGGYECVYVMRMCV